MICHLYPEPTYLIFSSEVPDLLYYSHIPVALLALFAGILVLLNGRTQLQNQLFFIICLCFSLWTGANLILWTDIHSNVLLFSWSFLGVLGSFISIFSVYFMYVFLDKKDVSVQHKLLFAALLTPVLLFGHTNLSLSGFDITYCDAFDYEGAIYKAYHGFLAALSFLWIGYLYLSRYKTLEASFKKPAMYMGIGIQSFLFLFFSMVYLASYLATIDVFQDSRLEMFGLFGMMIFMIMIGISMVKFKTFRIGLLASQALVIGLIVLVSSQFTFVTSVTSKILVSITLILTACTGLLLTRTITKEIAQRKKIEDLVLDLEKANVRLKQVDKLKSEFVSIASHQLRSPLTSISGYASLIREGTYGPLPEKMQDPIARIEVSARLMAESIEDYLNVSRIESGNMKYHLSDFNIKQEAEHLTDDLRADALRRGLILLFRTDLGSQGVVHADLGKTQQIIHNLLNNALKYTQKGSVTVFVRDNKAEKRIYVDVIDTGMGMSTDTLHSIFQKFERGDSANTVTVQGTGLGLYVAAKMAESMGGSIAAYSKGEGTGSRFTFELPLIG